MKVTTFAVVWIEIMCQLQRGGFAIVTTFAVVWIEIGITGSAMSGNTPVTTFAVVWIEIRWHRYRPGIRQRHHLRGGVD